MRLTVSSVLFLTAVLYLPTGQGRKIYSQLQPIEKELVDLAINDANQKLKYGHLNFYEIVDIKQFTEKQVTTVLGLRVTTCRKAPGPEHRHRPECPFKLLEVRCFVCRSQSNPNPYIDCVRRKDVTKTHHNEWDQQCQLNGRFSLLAAPNQIIITILFKDLVCYSGDGRGYRGMVARTSSGKTCQSWSAQTPHKHTRTPENYPCKGLDRNYCRNPDNERMPWCYTTESETRWEYCYVPSCGGASEPEPAIVPEMTCFKCEGTNYRGTVARTISGRTCQRWSAQTPHGHTRTPENHPDKGLDINYCRNPDNEMRPWCYTTDPEKRWEFCPINRCGDGPEPEPPTSVPVTAPPTSVPPPPKLVAEMDCYSGDGRDYRGTVARTISGKTCQRWSAQTPYSHDRTQDNYPCNALDINYCRNPDNERMPWCYTTDSQTRWEYCQVPRCEVVPKPELTCYTGIGTNYRGAVARTVSGKTCQRWSSQSPHDHERMPEDYPGKGLDSNYCRNPDEEGVPWCYTTDRKTRWENCDIPTCDSLTEPEPAIVPELTCFTCKGVNYRGEVAQTISGKTCQRWSAQTPHSHERTPENHPHSGLDSNYCRNPDKARMPWCYTTDSQTRWEFCDVPRCVPEPAQFSQCGQRSKFRVRVVGGIESELGEHPWQASLQTRTTGTSNAFKHKCGGVLIASCWVLTAAHCFNVTVSRDMQVVLGGVDIATHEAEVQVIPVERVIIHDDYRELSYALKSDIALLQLKATDSLLCAKETNYVKTACLPNRLFPDGEECVVSGWGQTEDRHRPNKLSKAVVPLISKRSCMAPDVYGDRLDDTMICAGYMEGVVDACKGDSGGPLICKEKGVHYVAGLVSWARGCGLKNKPGLYANVYKYREWITRMISPDADDYDVYSEYTDYENLFI